jgi:hypothetical protein
MKSFEKYRFVYNAFWFLYNLLPKPRLEEAVGVVYGPVSFSYCAHYIGEKIRCGLGRKCGSEGVS